MGMDFIFSEGFMHDLMEILKECDKRNESGGRLTFAFGEDILNVDIEFSVEEKAEEVDA